MPSSGSCASFGFCDAGDPKWIPFFFACKVDEQQRLFILVVVVVVAVVVFGVVVGAVVVVGVVVVSYCVAQFHSILMITCLRPDNCVSKKMDAEEVQARVRAVEWGHSTRVVDLERSQVCAVRQSVSRAPCLVSAQPTTWSVVYRIVSHFVMRVVLVSFGRRFRANARTHADERRNAKEFSRWDGAGSDDSTVRAPFTSP